MRRGDPHAAPPLAIRRWTRCRPRTSRHRDRHRPPGCGAKPPGPRLDQGPLLRGEAPSARPEQQPRRQRLLLEKPPCRAQTRPDGPSRASALGLRPGRGAVLDPPERVRHHSGPRPRPQPRLPARLRAADPNGPLEIQPNFLAEQADLDALGAGVELGLDLASQPAYRDLIKRWIVPPRRMSREDTVAFVRRSCSSYLHPVGTCAMGPGRELTN